MPGRKRRFSQTSSSNCSSNPPPKKVTRKVSFDCKSLLKGEQYSSVVSIDFGTTGTGMIFGMKCESESLLIQSPDWMDESKGRFARDIGRKIPSCVLFNPDKELVAFGGEAKHMADHCRCRDGSDIDKSWLFFEHYKMNLHNLSNSVSLDTLEISANNGQRMLLKDVLIEVMKYLKQRAMLCLKDQLESSIRWVITVPAIWNESSKSIMRDCAMKAGMGQNYDECVLLYEPEAAAIAIHKEWSEMKSEDEMKEGDKYMIVDCGGGTIDIVTHEWISPFQVCEVIAPSGGPWGSRLIDSGLAQVFRDIFGEDRINDLMKQSPTVWSQIMRECITAKEMFHKRENEDEKDDEDSSDDDDSDDGSYAEELMHLIRLPDSFIEILTKKEIKRAVKSYGKKNAKLEGRSQWCLGISDQIMHDVFDKPVKGITDHLKCMLNKHRSILLSGDKQLKRICLVGGFAESTYLESRVREAVSEVSGAHNVQVFVSDHPSQAVMIGAASLEDIRKFITARVLRNTYGFVCCMSLSDVKKWDYPPSNEELRGRMYQSETNNKGRKFVDQCFGVICAKGSAVRPGTIVESEKSYPSSLSQTAFDCTVYFSKEHNSNHLLPMDDSDREKTAVGGEFINLRFPDWFDKQKGYWIEKYEFGNEIELQSSITFYSPGHDPLTEMVHLFHIEESFQSK